MAEDIYAETGLFIQAATAFRTISTAEDDNAQSRAIELYMAGDERPVAEQLVSLEIVAAAMTADELRMTTDGHMPPSAATAEGLSPDEPRAAAWSAVLAVLRGDRPSAEVAVMTTLELHGSEGLSTAIGYLARLYREAHELRRAKATDGDAAHRGQAG